MMHCRSARSTITTTRRTRLPRYRPAVALLAVVVALCAGCGDGRTPVAGKVTFDGQPVQEGTITFEPADGQGPTTGGKILDGKYELTGRAAPVPGKKLVRIDAGRKTGRKVPIKVPAGDSITPRNEMVDEIERYIPEKYNTRSKLTCEVAPDARSDLNFELTSR